MLTQKTDASGYILLVKSIIGMCILLILLNAAILYAKGYRSLKFGGRSITVEMKTRIDGFSSVYFDTGFDYSESERYTFETGSSDFIKYRIPLPEAPIKSIRFDPLNNAEGPFEIKSIMVETRNNKWSWEDEKLAFRIVPLQQINVANIRPHFKGFSTGTDPNFHVEGLTIPANHFIHIPLLLTIAKYTAGIALMGMMVLLMINAWMRYGFINGIKNKIKAYFAKSIRHHGEPAVTTIRELCKSVKKCKQYGDLKWIGYAGLAVLVLLWGGLVWKIYQDTGLFRWIGADFALYYVQSIALWSGDPGAIYKPEVYDVTFQKLLSLYSPKHLITYASHIPYPPLFAWLFTPFTLSSPPVGFALWEIVNLFALIHLAWRVSQFFPGMRPSWVALVLFASFPVVYCLLVGQPQLLYACAVAECYLSLRKGRDFRAGLWLAILFFKPQYGILLGILLIWKRRWASVAGAVIGGLVVVAGSALAAGVETLMAYPSTLTDMKEFFTPDVKHMINWRSLVLSLGSGIGELKGMMLTYDLSLITLFMTAVVWRGEWRPDESRFSARFVLLLVATLLVNHHSFNYGAVLLILPLAAALAEGQRDRLTQLSVIAGIILPTLAFTIVAPRNVPLASLTLTFCLLSLYAGLLRRLWLYHESTVENQSPLILCERPFENKVRI